MPALTMCQWPEEGPGEGTRQEVQAGWALASPSQCPQCKQPQNCKDTGNTAGPIRCPRPKAHLPSLNFCSFVPCEALSGEGRGHLGHSRSGVAQTEGALGLSPIRLSSGPPQARRAAAHRAGQGGRPGVSSSVGATPSQHSTVGQADV